MRWILQDFRRDDCCEMFNAHCGGKLCHIAAVFKKTHECLDLAFERFDVVTCLDKHLVHRDMLTTVAGLLLDKGTHFRAQRGGHAFLPRNHASNHERFTMWKYRGQCIEKCGRKWVCPDPVP